METLDNFYSFINPEFEEYEESNLSADDFEQMIEDAFERFGNFVPSDSIRITSNRGSIWIESYQYDIFGVEYWKELLTDCSFGDYINFHQITNSLIEVSLECVWLDAELSELIHKILTYAELDFHASIELNLPLKAA